MALEEKLKVFKELKGFMGAGLFSQKGKLIASCEDCPLQIEIIGKLVNDLLLTAQKTTEKLGLGVSNALEIATLHGYKIFIQCYFGEKVSFRLILICSQESPIGMIRLRLSQLLPIVVEELI